MKKHLTDSPPVTEKTGWRDGHGDHPLDRYLKEGRIPHIWCAGCGIGTVFTAFIKALEKENIDIDKTAVVSGISVGAEVAVGSASFGSSVGVAVASAPGGGV